ncbi:hypothetical protein [Enhygromyxa salina]|nr:hypothetical protein [Enhygromyxa salina]
MKTHLASIVAAITVGCTSSADPRPEYHSEHAVIQTDYGPLCEGTLSRIDDEIERIDAALGIQDSSYISEVRIVGDEISDYCGRAGACVKFSSGRMYIFYAAMSSFVHEAVHQRANPTGVNQGKPLFIEGLATALSRPGCHDEAREFFSLEEYLEPASGYDLPRHAYYLGGELVHWLLETHGVVPFIEFMLATDAKDTPAQVQDTYNAFFGTSLKDDLTAHLRPVTAPFEPWELGCVAPEAERDKQGDGYRFRETLDCQSNRVQNDFSTIVFHGPGQRALVEWSIIVDESNAGYFELVGELPTGAHLGMRGCDCKLARPEHTVGVSPPPVGSHDFWSGREVLLGPGRYIVTGRGPFGEVLDLELSMPCTLEAANCPAGQQCSIWNRCEPETALLAEPGDMCEVIEGVRSCEAGSRCVSGTCVAECDAAHPCADGAVCGLTRLCGPPCDLLAQDCGPGSSCALGSGPDDPGQCVPSGAGQLLDTCHRLDDTCSSGLVCGDCGRGQVEGCCVPLCESDDGCPAEAPACGIPTGWSVGVCV